MGVWVPIAVAVLVPTLHRNGSPLRSHAGLCCLALTIGMSEFIVQTAKVYVGRMRPNFYGMCGFDLATLQCMADHKHQAESRQSFPSGHSSLSFGSMGVLTWFLLGCWLHYCRQQRRKNGSGLSALQAKIGVLSTFLPLAFAAWVATSRLVDNWHHPSDVVAGSVIGLLCSTLSYHLWFHPVTSNKAGLPLGYSTANKSHAEIMTDEILQPML